MNGLNLEFHSFTISVWLWTGFTHAGSLQGLFRSQGSVLHLQVTPSSGQLTLNTATNIPNPGTLSKK